MLVSRINHIFLKSQILSCHFLKWSQGLGNSESNLSLSLTVIVLIATQTLLAWFVFQVYNVFVNLQSNTYYSLPYRTAMVPANSVIQKLPCPLYQEEPEAKRLKGWSEIAEIWVGMTLSGYPGILHSLFIISTSPLLRGFNCAACFPPCSCLRTYAFWQGHHWD